LYPKSIRKRFAGRRPGVPAQPSPLNISSLLTDRTSPSLKGGMSEMEVMVELRWCRRWHVVVGASGGVWQRGADGKLASTMMKLPRNRVRVWVSVEGFIAGGLEEIGMGGGSSGWQCGRRGVDGAGGAVGHVATPPWGRA
jgi:hypothetical protein